MKLTSKSLTLVKKCSVDVTGACMISKPPFNPKPSITPPMLPKRRTSSWNPLKRITNTICRYFDISKGFMYKGWSKVMPGVSILNFSSLVTKCTGTRNILQWDLMHWDQQLQEVLCEFFLNMFQWLLIAYNRLHIVWSWLWKR